MQNLQKCLKAEKIKKNLMKKYVKSLEILHMIHVHQIKGQAGQICEMIIRIMKNCMGKNKKNWNFGIPKEKKNLKL